MKLTKKAIKRIRLDVPLKNRLALGLTKSVHTIERWISDNDDNLTKAAALQIIREETGLTDAEILEEETEVVKNRA